MAPKYAVLMIGGNDARMVFQAQLTRLTVQYCHKPDRADHGLCGYLSRENSGVNMSALNTWIANPAGCNCTYIDVNNGFSQTGSGVPTTWLASDSVHPAEVFHTYIAQTITGRLQMTR